MFACANSDLTRRNFLKTAVAGSVAAGMATGAFSLFGAQGTAFADDEKAAGADAPSGETKTGQATVPSMKGDITVFVTMEGDKISKIDVLDDVDTPIIRDVAIEGMTRRIVENQSVSVDTVTGATMTSMAIANGVSTAIESIGLSADDYKVAVEAPAKKEGEAEDFDLVVSVPAWLV